jgi:hypothetical protein
MTYKCKICSRMYTHKYNYDRHITCCEFLNMSQREQENEVEMSETPPSLQNMYRLLQELSFKVNKLEKENTILKQKFQQRCKVNVLDWLNNQPNEIQPTITFENWVEQCLLSNVHAHLCTVYSNNLIMGVISLWKEAVGSGLTVPIKLFDNRPSSIYLYTANEYNVSSWIQTTPAILDKQLKRIFRQFIAEFKTHWYDKHVNKIHVNEEYMNMYINYYQKILGESKNTTDEMCQKIRHQIYLLIKQKVNNIIDINFS